MVDEEELIKVIAPTMRNAGVGIEYSIHGGLILNSATLCAMCHTPTANYHLCYTCGQRGYLRKPPTYFLTYSGITEQSKRDMFAYKDPEPSGPAVARLKILLYLGLKHHIGCITEVMGGLDAVTYVPSGKRDISAVKGLLPGMPYEVFDMRYVQPYRTTRAAGFDSENFTAERQHVENKKILLIEDSWFKGFNARSAAEALLRLGAADVSILSIARAVSPEYQGALFQSKYRDMPYDPAFCPVQLSVCGN